LVLRVVVHPADVQHRAGAPQLLLPLAAAGVLPRLELIWADSAYIGPLQTWVRQTCGWHLEIVQRPGGRGWWLPADQEPRHGSPASSCCRAAGSTSGRLPGSGATGA
jgi:hypothetical protein